MLDCTIEGNAGTYGTGGVRGEAVLRRCTIRGNQGYEAGGIFLHGRGRAIDCAITENSSIEGTTGGGVHLVGSTPYLLRCLVARNVGASLAHYPVASAGVYVFSPSGAPLIQSCTIAGNVVLSPHVPPGEDCGGVQGPAQLVNSIVYGNDGLAIGLRGPTGAAYSDIEGGHPGPGNFDLDPLFVDAASGDYHLTPGSPCIDAGVPLASFDEPDCTRADVGVFHFPQGKALFRNGSGVNLPFLASLSPPRLGSGWSARVLASLVPGSILSVITGRTQALEPGIRVPQGELLVDGPEIFRVFGPSSGVVDDYLVPIPNNAALIGREVHVQGVLLSGRGLHLGNAFVLRLGN
jgi:hypothetical protein